MLLAEGRTAVVTGAASGIGRALAEAFLGRGMRVVVADRDAVGLREMASGLGMGPDRVLAETVDVSDRRDVERLADRAFDHFGAVHVLCNNAGVSGPFGVPAWELPLDEWERVIGVDFWSVVYGVKAFVPRMLDRGEPGHVLNTASMAGVTANAVDAPYGASKHAVVGLTRSLSLQLARQGATIGASVLCPGPTLTNLFNYDTPGSSQALDMDFEFQSPEDVARITLEAIERGDLFVFPHALSKTRVEAATSGILSSPTLSL